MLSFADLLTMTTSSVTGTLEVRAVFRLHTNNSASAAASRLQTLVRDVKCVGHRMSAYIAWLVVDSLGVLGVVLQVEYPLCRGVV